MYRDILLTIDLNDETFWNKALPAAVEYCTAFGAKLHVVTVLPDFGMNLVGDYFPLILNRRPWPRSTSVSTNW